MERLIVEGIVWQVPFIPMTLTEPLKNALGYYTGIMRTASASIIKVHNCSCGQSDHLLPRGLVPLQGRLLPEAVRTQELVRRPGFLRGPGRKPGLLHGQDDCRLRVLPGEKPLRSLGRRPGHVSSTAALALTAVLQVSFLHAVMAS